MTSYHRLAKIALILAVFVIMLGAYTRLTDAGLGCPDWPGCYGHIVLQPGLTATVAHKAWTEMVHRYVAGTLGLLILILVVWGLVNWKRGLQQSVAVLFLLVGVLIFQAALGMWTVTLKLLPLVVTGHLLGGMAIAGLLSWLVASTKPNAASLNPHLEKWIVLGLCILVIQLFLGAWTSTNYAALACGTHFPGCAGAVADWAHAFNIFSPVGPNYEGGLLTMAARVAIQMAHRYWALITFIYLAGLALALGKRGGWLLALLCLQVSLGILNVVELLPLGVAVAHNGVAVLLLITTIALWRSSAQQRLA